jgi:hypothetical protein
MEKTKEKGRRKRRRTGGEEEIEDKWEMKKKVFQF